MAHLLKAHPHEGEEVGVGEGIGKVNIVLASSEVVGLETEGLAAEVVAMSDTVRQCRLGVYDSIGYGRSLASGLDRASGLDSHNMEDDMVDQSADLASANVRFLTTDPSSHVMSSAAVVIALQIQCLHNED